MDRVSAIISGAASNATPGRHAAARARVSAAIIAASGARRFAWNDGLDEAGERALLVVRGVVLDDMPDVLGAVQQHEVPAPQPERHDVAVLAGDLVEEPQGIAADPGKDADERKPPRSRRRLHAASIGRDRPYFSFSISAAA
jgi:hypothetical protein